MMTGMIFLLLMERTMSFHFCQVIAIHLPLSEEMHVWSRCFICAYSDRIQISIRYERFSIDDEICILSSWRFWTNLITQIYADVSLVWIKSIFYLNVHPTQTFYFARMYAKLCSDVDSMAVISPPLCQVRVHVLNLNTHNVRKLVVREGKVKLRNESWWGE